MRNFVHLHVHSTYSLLDGLGTIPKIVRRARELGMPALALTDHGNLFGLYEFYEECQKTSRYDGLPTIKPILGCEVYVTDSGDYNSRNVSEKRHHLCLYAKNETGYRNLVWLVTEAHKNGFYHKPRIDKSILEKCHEGLVCASGCMAGEVASLIDKGDLAGAERAAAWYKGVFGADYYLEVMLHPTIRKSPDVPSCMEEEFQDLYKRQRKVVDAVLALGKKLDISCIATNDVHFINRDDVDASDVLLALGTGKKLIDTCRLSYTGSEWMKSADEMTELFPNNPEVIENTIAFADRIEKFELAQMPDMPEFDVPGEFGTLEGYRKRFDEAALMREFNAGVRPWDLDRLGGYESVLKIKLQSDYLRELTYRGARWRWGEKLPKEVRERLDYELDVVKHMGCPGYFLIVQDYVAAAKRMGIIVGPGRGSAVASAIVYALGITSVDPLRHDLVFERFLNPDRISFPDIDVDFEDERRQEVFDYISQKYGEGHAARMISFGTFGPRMAIKDVCRVLDYPLNAANRLASLVPYKPRMRFDQALRESSEMQRIYDSGEPIERKILRLAEKLDGCVRQPGMHACAVVISRSEMSDRVPMCYCPESPLPVTQFDGNRVECMGLLKLDILSLAELSIQKRCLRTIDEDFHVNLNLDEIPFNDSATLNLFSKGDTIGVFQFETPGMQKWLKTLKPTSFKQLVALNALYRPGPMDQIPEFVARAHGEAAIRYDHPLLEETTADTYGLMVYQEQLMLSSRVLAGFTRGQADKLRKAMAKKQMAIMDELHGKFVLGCLENPRFRVDGYEKESVAKECAERIWKGWSAYAAYAFCKSHAVGYTKLAFQSAYLKAHYPAAFVCAVASKAMGSGGDALRAYIPGRDVGGVTLLRPDVNASGADFSTENGGEALRFALGAVKGVGLATAEAIVAEREKNGRYEGFCSFVSRMRADSGCACVTRRIVENLIWAGAFDSLFNEGHGFARERMHRGIDVAFDLAETSAREAKTGMLAGLGVDLSDGKLPPAPIGSPVEIIRHEREVLGVLAFANDILGHIPYGLDGLVPDSEAYEVAGMTSSDGVVVHVGGILSAIRVSRKTEKPGEKFARISLEDGSGVVEVLMTADLYGQYMWLADYIGCPALASVEVRQGKAYAIAVDLPASCRKEAV